MVRAVRDIWLTLDTLAACVVAELAPGAALPDGAAGLSHPFSASAAIRTIKRKCGLPRVYDRNMMPAPRFQNAVSDFHPGADVRPMSA
jgi:hypothetical protein